MHRSHLDLLAPRPRTRTWLLHRLSTGLGLALLTSVGVVNATPTEQPGIQVTAEAAPRTTATEPPPIIDVYTMGPGADLFSQFGHAAICVSDAKDPQGRCYNYGTADFSTPGPLTWNFLRGRALFWVSVVPQPYMVALYAHEDRTLYRQRLPLPAAAAHKLAAKLHQADQREATYYRYHHFRDNCTTRIRDLVDDATEGALRKSSQTASDPPLRHYVQQGFDSSLPLLLLMDVLLGRAADPPSTRWQGMFLPELLREELTTKLRAPAVAIYTRQAPSSGGEALLPRPVQPLRWRWMLPAVGALLALWQLSQVRADRLGKKSHQRLAQAAAGLVLGSFGLLCFGMFAVSVLPELRYNEAVLVCLPTDILLLGLPLRLGRRYAQLRLCGLALVCLLSLLGVLLQPLGPVLLLCALPLAALAFTRVTPETNESPTAHA